MPREKLGRTRDMHIFLTPEDYETVRRIADELGQTIPTFVARAVTEAIRRFDEQTKKRKTAA